MKSLISFINEYYYHRPYPIPYNKRSRDDMYDKPKYDPIRKITFKNYDDVTDEDVKSFWNQEKYKNGLIPIEDIRKEWQPAYELAKKNIAMYSYVLNSHENIFFDKEGNLLIDTLGKSHKSHISYYKDTKFKKFFNTEIGINYVNSPYKEENKKTWEMIYNGKIDNE